MKLKTVLFVPIIATSTLLTPITALSAPVHFSRHTANNSHHNVQSHHFHINPNRNHHYIPPRTYHKHIYSPYIHIPKYKTYEIQLPAYNPVDAYKDHYNTNNYSSYALEIRDLVNAERASYGLQPLKLSSTLCSAADVRAQEQAISLGHTRPNGTTYHTILGSPNAYMAENAAGGQLSPESVVKSWMDSPGHRANILNNNMQILGVGYYYDENSQYKHHWIQLFMG